MDKGRALSDAPASAWEVADRTELDQRSNQTRDYLKLNVPLVVSIDNARLYHRRLKHLVTALVAVCGLATPLGRMINCTCLPNVITALRILIIDPLAWFSLLHFFVLG